MNFLQFEEQATNRISVIQRLDIVHQNVVRYNILLEAYKKYLVPDSHEFIECESEYFPLFFLIRIYPLNCRLAIYCWVETFRSQEKFENAFFFSFIKHKFHM